MQLAWPKLLGSICFWTESSSGVFGLYLISILWKCLIATHWYAIYIVYTYADARMRLFLPILKWQKIWFGNVGLREQWGWSARSSHNHLVSSCHHCLLDFVITYHCESLSSLFVVCFHHLVIIVNFFHHIVTSFTSSHLCQFLSE